MKKFLTTLALFALPVVLVSYPLDWFLSRSLKKSNHYARGEYSVWNDIYAGKAGADILIYGSSRAWIQIDPQIFEDSLHHSTYNFGIDGHHFQLEYMRHLAYLQHNPKPRVIVFSLEAHTLSAKEELYNKDQFLPYMLADGTLYDYTRSLKGFNVFDYSLPLVRYYGNDIVLNLIVKNSLQRRPDPPFRIKGYQAADQTWNGDLDRAKRQMKGYRVDFDSSSVRLFDRFARECARNGIRLVLVYTPEYIEGQRFYLNRPGVINFYKEFALANYLPFLDYSSDTMCLSRDYFYNAQHMNRTGSELFTRKLVHDLKFLPEFQSLDEGGR